MVWRAGLWSVYLNSSTYILWLLEWPEARSRSAGNQHLWETQTGCWGIPFFWCWTIPYCLWYLQAIKENHSRRFFLYGFEIAVLHYLRHVLFPVRCLQPVGHVCPQTAHLIPRDIRKLYYASRCHPFKALTGRHITLPPGFLNFHSFVQNHVFVPVHMMSA